MSNESDCTLRPVDGYGSDTQPYDVTRDVDLTPLYSDPLDSDPDVRNVQRRLLVATGSLAVSRVAEQVVGPDGYLSSEFIERRLETYTYVPPRKKVVIGCSDDRRPTPESIIALNARYADRQVLDIEKGYARIFGGLAGLAKNVLVAGHAVYGDHFSTALPSFNAALRAVARLYGDRVTLHSDVKHEEQASGLCMHGASAVGCAYCAGVGTTTQLLLEDERIRVTATNDQVYVFGNDEHVENLRYGHELTARMLAREAGSNDPCDFSIDRRDFKELHNGEVGVPIMVLAGGHVATQASGVISSFNLSHVGSTVAAHEQEQSLAYYGLDIAHVTASIGLLLQEYGIPPEIFARALQLDSVPVRAVLAAHDPDLNRELDPTKLAMGVTGNPKEALAYLNRQFGNR